MGLSLDVPGRYRSRRRRDPDKSVLSFDHQKGEGEGLLVTSKDVTLRDFAVENARGNGIKGKAADGISFVRLTVRWTGGPKETNGAYGVYPVSSTNVLIDHVTVSGASDAGIYVGQSKNIVVRDSRAEYNVAGIEIENSYDADVTGNVATKNAGGSWSSTCPACRRWAATMSGCSATRSSPTTRRTSPPRAISSRRCRPGPG